MKPDYDTGVARMAGNIAAGLLGNQHYNQFSYEEISRRAVMIAKLIVVELKVANPPNIG